MKGYTTAIQILISLARVDTYSHLAFNMGTDG